MKTSATLSALTTALSKFQSELEAAHKSTANPFYRSKYADLAELWNTTRDLLGKHGLAFVQTFNETKVITNHFSDKETTTITDEDGKVTVTQKEIQTSKNTFTVCIETTLFHESGEWIGDSKLILPTTKDDPQQTGSAITYGRRYAMAAFLGIHQEDDDANSHVKKTSEKVIRQEPTPKPEVKASQNKAVDIANDQLAAIKEKIYPLFAGLIKDDKTLISEKYADEGKTLSASKTLPKLNDCYSELLQREIVRMYDELAAMNPKKDQYYKVASIKKHTKETVLSGNISECKDHETLEKLKSHLTDEISKENSAVQ